MTIKDIASALNVSPSTVGRALAGDPRISDAMKRRVQKAAQQSGYIANRAAQMMRGASSKLVGLIVPDIRNNFYSTIAHSLSLCMLTADYQLTLCETDDDPALELRHIRELSSANVAGIIIVPSARPDPETVRLLQRTIHIQLLRHQEEIGNQWFGIDDALATYQAARHVIELGHRRIAYIGGQTDLPTGLARLEGFRRAIENVRDTVATFEELGAPASIPFGSRALRKLLESPEPPTALVMGAVQNTLGVLDELNAAGMAVPDGLSLVGFGDEPAYRWWRDGLTTVRIPVSELATAGGLWLLHQIKQEKPSGESYSFVSLPELVVRKSTTAFVT